MVVGGGGVEEEAGVTWERNPGQRRKTNTSLRPSGAQRRLYVRPCLQRKCSTLMRVSQSAVVKQTTWRRIAA